MTPSTRSGPSPSAPAVGLRLPKAVGPRRWPLPSAFAVGPRRRPPPSSLAIGARVSYDSDGARRKGENANKQPAALGPRQVAVPDGFPVYPLHGIKVLIVATLVQCPLRRRSARCTVLGHWHRPVPVMVPYVPG